MVLLVNTGAGYDSMVMEPFSARLFMVDISGYTKFLTRTSLQHANKVVTEILERLNDAIDIRLNKIEGDALLFYTRTKSVEDIIELSHTLRELFFEMVEELEKEHSNCQYEICHRLSQLNIKFFVTSGMISKHEIGSFCELIGEPVVEIHRIAKNDIEHDSYIVVVSDSGNECREYTGIGEICYDTILFSDSNR